MAWRDLEVPTDEVIRQLDLEFRGKIRFLVDENAGEGVADALRQMGFNSRSARELGLAGRSDEDVFAAAWRENRVIITHDDDFLNNRRFPHHRNPGVVVIRPGADGRDDNGLTRCLVLTTMLGAEHAAFFRGTKIEFTSDETYTVLAQGTKVKYRWKRGENPQIWED